MIPNVSCIFFILAFFLLLTGVHIYGFITLKLETSEAPLTLLDKVYVFIITQLVLSSGLTLVFILFRASFVVPIYTLDSLPPIFHPTVFSLLSFYGIYKATLLRKLAKGGEEEVYNVASVSILRMSMRPTSGSAYVSDSADWYFRILCLVLHNLFGKYLKYVLSLAGQLDDLFFLSQGGNAFLCYLSTVLYYLLKAGLPSVFLISGLPPFVYGVATLVLFLYAVASILLRVNSRIYTYYLLGALKGMETDTYFAKQQYILAFLQNCPTTEELLYSFCSHDFYMSRIKSSKITRSGIVYTLDL